MILFLPFPSQITPPWRVQVVDEKGEPVQRSRVSESWGWWPIDKNHTEVQLTGENGWVAFERRTLWASLFRRCIGRLSPLFSFHGDRYEAFLMFVAVKDKQKGSPALAAFTYGGHPPGVVEKNGALTFRMTLKPLRTPPN